MPVNTTYLFPTSRTFRLYYHESVPPLRRFDRANLNGLVNSLRHGPGSGAHGAYRTVGINRRIDRGINDRGIARTYPIRVVRTLARMSMPIQPAARSIPVIANLAQMLGFLMLPPRVARIAVSA